MITFFAMLDPLTWNDEAMRPPNVEGGIIGDTENGYLAIYKVPDDQADAFELAMRRSEVLRCDRK